MSEQVDVIVLFKHKGRMWDVCTSHDLPVKPLLALIHLPVPFWRFFCVAVSLRIVSLLWQSDRGDG